MTKGGDLIPTLESATPIHSEAGVLVGYVWVNTDISGLRRAREGRQEAEEIYHAVFDNAHDAIAVDSVTEDGTVRLFVNDAFLRLYGLRDKSEAIGRPVSAFILEEDWGEVYDRALARQRGEAVPPVYECRIRRSDGQVRVVEASVAPISFGRKPATLALLRDVTARGEAEQLLRESEEDYRLTTEMLPDGIFKMTTEGELTFVNGSFARMLGYQPGELIGTHYQRLVGGGMEESQKNFATLMSGQAVQNETMTRHKDGHLVPVSYVSVPIVQDGEIVGLMGSCRDITERKQTEAALRQTSRLASIGELAAGVAHEINNPINSIMGFTELLMEEEEFPPHVQTDLERIYSASQRAGRIVENLLSFARQRQPHMQPVDLAAIIKTALELKSHDYQVGNISIETQLAEALPRITGDRDQLLEVLLNVLNNAEDAVAGAGSGGRVTVGAQAGDDTVRISISDNGPGIPPDQQESIFDPFFTTKQVDEGTGLGLSICYGIVEQHGGQLTVHSSVGKGATFEIELPIRNGEATT